MNYVHSSTLKCSELSLQLQLSVLIHLVQIVRFQKYIGNEYKDYVID